MKAGDLEAVLEGLAYGADVKVNVGGTEVRASTVEVTFPQSGRPEGLITIKGGE